jgi:hypothetical protein
VTDLKTAQTFKKIILWESSTSEVFAWALHVEIWQRTQEIKEDPSHKFPVTSCATQNWFYITVSVQISGRG